MVHQIYVSALYAASSYLSLMANAANKIGRNATAAIFGSNDGRGDGGSYEPSVSHICTLVGAAVITGMAAVFPNALFRNATTAPSNDQNPGVEVAESVSDDTYESSSSNSSSHPLIGTGECGVIIFDVKPCDDSDQNIENPFHMSDVDKHARVFLMDHRTSEVTSSIIKGELGMYGVRFDEMAPSEEGGDAGESEGEYVSDGEPEVQSITNAPATPQEESNSYNARDFVNDAIQKYGRVVFLTFEDTPANTKGVYLRMLVNDIDPINDRDVRVVNLLDLFYLVHKNVRRISYDELMTRYNLPRRGVRHLEFVDLFEKIMQDFESDVFQKEDSYAYAATAVWTMSDYIS